jgi:hypothetical protein
MQEIIDSLLFLSEVERKEKKNLKKENLKEINLKDFIKVFLKNNF